MWKLSSIRFTGLGENTVSTFLLHLHWGSSSSSHSISILHKGSSSSTFRQHLVYSPRGARLWPIYGYSFFVQWPPLCPGVRLQPSSRSGDDRSNDPSIVESQNISWEDSLQVDYKIIQFLLYLSLCWNCCQRVVAYRSVFTQNRKLTYVPCFVGVGEELYGLTGWHSCKNSLSILWLYVRVFWVVF